LRKSRRNKEQSFCAELLHEPVGNVGSAIETLFAVTHAIEHFSLRRITAF
jgi:hypothetical protein